MVPLARYAYFKHILAQNNTKQYEPIIIKGILEFFKNKSNKAIKNNLTFKEFLANILKCESDLCYKATHN